MIDQTTQQTSGKKCDEGKLPWDLLPYDALAEVVKAFQFGMQGKPDGYAPRGWESGIKYMRVFGSVMRHLTAWVCGENINAESGLNHLAHAIAQALFLLTYVTRKLQGFDDRVKTVRGYEVHNSISGREVYDSEKEALPEQEQVTMCDNCKHSDRETPGFCWYCAVYPSHPYFEEKK